MTREEKYEKYNGELCEKLHQISHSLDISVRQQAVDMGYTPIELHNIFHQKRIMHIEDAERIADYLGYRIELIKK